MIRSNKPKAESWEPRAVALRMATLLIVIFCLIIIGACSGPHTASAPITLAAAAPEPVALAQAASALAAGEYEVTIALLVPLAPRSREAARLLARARLARVDASLAAPATDPELCRRAIHQISLALAVLPPDDSLRVELIQRRATLLVGLSSNKQ